MGGLDRMMENYQQQGVATGDPDADAFLRENPNALLIGVLLDQQIRAEMAFTGPLKLYQRLGHLDMKRIAEMDPDEFRRLFAEKPSVHRFANMMAERVQTLARAVVEQYDGDAGNLWLDGASPEEVQKRAKKLPGFGPGKVQTLVHARELFRSS